MMNVSASAEVYLKAETPRDMRLMAARGAIPLPPRDLLCVLDHLSRDPDPEIAGEAKKSLESTPQNILKTTLASDLPASLLEHFSQIRKNDPEIIEVLILNRSTSDAAVAEIARSSNPKILEIISHNQERMIRSAAILNNLLENPYLSQVSRDRLLEFFAGQAVLLPSETKAGLPADTQAELPADVQAGLPAPAGTQAPPILSSIAVPQDLLEDKKEPLTEEEHKSLYQKIQKMTASAKIKLALLGSKEARNILIRDPNKLVAAAVVKSPKITEAEIAMVAQSRNVSDEVLRLISSNKEWMKNYQIKLALVGNPKTPLPIAMRFLSTLKDMDIKQLSMSRNVSGAIVTAAKRLVTGKG